MLNIRQLIVLFILLSTMRFQDTPGAENNEDPSTNGQTPDDQKTDPPATDNEERPTETKPETDNTPKPDSSSSCKENCLKCSADDKCLFCDYSLNFFLIDGVCASKVIDQCEMTGINGTCLGCKPQHFLDNDKCVEVSTIGAIPNCLYYIKNGDKFECVGCDPDFIVANEACAAVPVQIPNCSQYDLTGSLCYECFQGVPNFSNSACVSPPDTLTNCESYQLIECLECKDGFIADKNLYLNYLFEDEGSLQADKLVLMKNEILKRGPLVEFNSCRPKSIKHCQTFIDHQTCSKCEAFHFLTSAGICEQYPEEMIDFCEDYLSANECLNCQEGYYWVSHTKCEKVKEVTNCISYSRTEEQVCLECDEAFFSEITICSPRTLLVEKCKKYYRDRDLCEECDTDYVLDTTFTKCLNAINNCKTHSVSGEEVSCVFCHDNFYLSEGTCNFGNIDGCKDYTSETECLVCKETFYRTDDFQCAKHNLETRIFCDEFSITNLNFCNKCPSSMVRFDLNNLCLPVNSPVTNCSAYETDGVCNKCNEKEFYLADGACVAGEINRCDLYATDERICQKCIIDKILNLGYVPNNDNPNNQCVLADPNNFYNCNEIKDTKEKPCDSCLESYYPKVLPHSTIRYCLPNNFHAFANEPAIQNCSLFDITTLKCKICDITNEGKYYSINEEGRCVLECPTNFFPDVFQVTGNLINTMFMCTETTAISAPTFVTKFSHNCTIYGMNHDTSERVCLSCADGMLGVYDFTAMAKKASQFSYLQTTSITSYLSYYNRVAPIRSCLSSNLANTTTSSGTNFARSINLKNEDVPVLDNCRYIVEIDGSNGEYYCGSCRIGFSGQIVKNANSQTYMIETCDLLPECKRDIWINGLGSLPGQISDANPTPIDFFVSCHICEVEGEEDSIPTYGIALSDVNSVTPPIVTGKTASFGVSITTNSDAPYLLSESNPMQQTSCQLPGLSQAGSFPQHCGIQQIDITKILGSYVNKAIVAETNPICVACKPGYKATTMSTIITEGIDDCEKIENCAESTEFNRCTYCVDGFALKNGTNFTECVASTTNNCYIFDTGLARCTKCRKGYILNIDHKCDLVELYGCEQYGFLESSGSLEEGMSLYDLGHGCQKCNNNTINVVVNATKQYCVKNPYLPSEYSPVKDEDGNLPYVFSLRIANCKFYGIEDDTIICKSCRTGFISQIDNKACHTIIQLPNCEIAQLGGQVCAKCVEGSYFSVEEASCVEGEIEHCKYYTDIKNCSECQDGYMSVKISGAKTVCLETKTLNCASLDLTLALQGHLRCNTCDAGYYVSTEEKYGKFPIKDCIEIPQVENCVKYDKTTSVKTSILNCLECDEGYFVANNGKCVERSFTIQGCTTYNPVLDECSVCEKGRYLTSVKTVCKKNPSSVVGCIEFAEGNICLKCGINRYLNENRCNEVPEDNYIPNCRYYLNDVECLVCDKNYFLTKNTCEQAIASDCATYINEKECATCDEGFGLSQSVQIVNCTQVVVPNCENPDVASEGPNFKCLKCIKDFYLDTDGNCKTIETKIANCEYYENPSTCAKCALKYVLDEKKERCIGESNLHVSIDPNCINNYQTITCSTCKEGYMFDLTGACVSCDATLLGNCAYCDPDDKTKCLVCKSGFVHTKEGTCLSSSQIDDNNGGTDGGDNGGDGASSTILFTLYAIIPLLISLIN